MVLNDTECCERSNSKSFLLLEELWRFYVSGSSPSWNLKWVAASLYFYLLSIYQTPKPLTVSVSLLVIPKTCLKPTKSLSTITSAILNELPYTRIKTNAASLPGGGFSLKMKMKFRHSICNFLHLIWFKRFFVRAIWIIMSEPHKSHLSPNGCTVPLIWLISVAWMFDTEG